MIRVIAKDVLTMETVNVTTRKYITDFTKSNLNVPAYYHKNRKTVSGRLRAATNPDDFAELEFFPNK